MQTQDIDGTTFIDHEERERRIDPWRANMPKPNLTKSATLGELLERSFFSILPAHVMAADKTARLDSVVRYRDDYAQRGIRNVWDLEFNGVLYRYCLKKIYSKRWPIK